MSKFAINDEKPSKMKRYSFLAFDLGATSGRAVIGTLNREKFDIEEIHRFPNNIIEIHGKYYWNIYSLYEELKKALSICAEKDIKPCSIGIDTWGVDFGYIAADGTLMALPRAYRDPYTNGIPEEYFKIISRKELYDRTGIQIMNFNSLFQLFAAKKENSETLRNAHKILFIPDLLSYLLTGKMVCEYTEASTSQLIDPEKHSFDCSLLEMAEISSDILLPPVMPGSLIGELTDALARETGIGKVPVYAVAGHDTASAIAATPATDCNFAYLSSGTWSLMGIESEKPIINEETLNNNFTNEGGIDGTTCFLKNITGMWLLEQCRKEWSKEGLEYSYDEIIKMAKEAEPFRSLINPDDPCFANPCSMTKAIDEFCKKTGQLLPASHGEFIRCIFDSLTLCYKDTLKNLCHIAPFEIKKLHIIGGGSRNSFLNQLTANATGITVVAGPAEATAIGNCMIQARAAGIIGDRWQMRRLINDVLPPDIYIPQEQENWENAYKKYKELLEAV